MRKHIVQPSGIGTVSANSNDQKESDDSNQMKKTQIGSDNNNVNIEILKIEEVNAEDISNDNDAWWKYSAPGPSHKNEEWKSKVLCKVQALYEKILILGNKKILTLQLYQGSFSLQVW